MTTVVPLVKPSTGTKTIKTLRDYFSLASITLADNGELLNRAHCITGIKTECGEALDQLKRHVFYKKPFDIVNIAEEMGDICWYGNIALKEVQEKGLEKVFPIKNSDIVKYLDVPLEAFVNFSVAEYLSTGEDDEYADDRDFMSEVFSDFEFDLTEAFDCILREIYDIEEPRLLDVCDVALKMCAVASFSMGIPFENILKGNIAKLLKRYPKERFDELDTSLRDLAQEANKVEAAIKGDIPLARSNYNLSYTIDFPYYEL